MHLVGQNVQEYLKFGNKFRLKEKIRSKCGIQQIKKNVSRTQKSPGEKKTKPRKFVKLKNTKETHVSPPLQWYCSGGKNWTPGKPKLTRLAKLHTSATSIKMPMAMFWWWTRQWTCRQAFGLVSWCIGCHPLSTQCDMSVLPARCVYVYVPDCEFVK